MWTITKQKFQKGIQKIPKGNDRKLKFQNGIKRSPKVDQIRIEPRFHTVYDCAINAVEKSTDEKIEKNCSMENLKFEPKHNLVACLDESILETEGYRDMIRFIRRTKYVYAMCAKPVIYARLIKSFWRTAEVLTDEAGVTVVRGNITRDLVLTVSEEAIRTALRIDDDEIGGNDELTNAECQACFVNMGHPPVFPKS
ncbi:hypothetical protein QVD17_41430 [Tagetes erecta]|uniref:Uncharacterized protein n=1 Tax=Tagetes erecta TaxID=13708 RepID=A0AAD8NFL8_TARER|nr:hypothetical protein QVD17_41430 [Tagetes erecta]